MNGAVRIRNSKHKKDDSPIEIGCDCYTCKNFSRAYLHHLDKAKELLFYTLSSIHNVRFMQRFMVALQKSIEEDRFLKFRSDILDIFYDKN